MNHKFLRKNEHLKAKKCRMQFQKIRYGSSVRFFALNYTADRNKIRHVSRKQSIPDSLQKLIGG